MRLTLQGWQTVSIKLPISTFIIALNEADRIEYSINSVKDWVDEVIVIDSGSHDGTTEVSERAGARVLYNEWKGYGLQKRFGEEQCRNDWLLNIDADEVISESLRDEIINLFKQKMLPHSGYYLPIIEILPTRSEPSLFGHGLKAVRLYDMRAGRYSDSTVHDRVILDKGSTGELKNVIIHRSSRSLTHSVEKLNRYSTMQVENMVERGKRPNFFRLRIIFEFPIAFLKAYIARRYIFQGFSGFINSMVYAFSRFIRIAKYHEYTITRQKNGKL